MIAIFFKEFRQTIKWAAMISGLFCVLILFRTKDADPFFLYDLTDPITLLYAPLAGLAMGFAQSLFETKPDNWAFVVHRPVSRRAIFAGKCAAGLLLLMVALALPCLLAVLWATRPGNLPLPFQGRMVLPMLADVLSAGCYYFVGIILTLRKARWFGTRLLPVGFAFVCSVAVRLAPDFWQVLVMVFVGYCIGALAAWGAFSAGGAGEVGGAPAAALGAMIFAGALTIGCLCGGTLGIFESDLGWHGVRMDKQGNVVRTIKTLSDDDLTYAVTDIAGHPLPEYDGINLDDPESANRFVRFSAPLLDDRELPWPLSTMGGGGYRSARAGIRSLRAVAPQGVRVNDIALLDVHERWIDLYDPMTRTLKGRIGAAGYSAGAGEPAERFPSEPLNAWSQSNTRTLSFASAVYWMDLSRRTVTKIFTASQADPVVAAHEISSATDPTIFILTKSRLHLVRPSSEILLSIPLDVDLAKFSVAAATLTANHHLVLRVEALVPDLADSAPPLFVEYAADGTFVRRAQPREVEQIGNITVLRTALFGLTHPVLALPVRRAWIIDSIFGLDSQHHDHLFLGCMLAGGVLSLIATFLLARRYGFGPSKTARWCVTNLLIGPTGIVVLAGLNERPANEICAACQGRRLADRAACPRCGTSLPPATLDGREIFEPGDALIGCCPT